MTTLPKNTPFYGGGQVPNPANVIQTSGVPSSVLTEDGIGSLAIDNSAAAGYLLVSKSGGINTWLVFQGAGSSGSFANLTSSGATTLATAGAAANSSFGSGNTSGTISIGAAAMTGALSVGISTSGQVINVGSVINAGASTINIASAAAGAATTVNILSGVSTAGAQAVNIANGAAASTVTIGNSTGASAINIRSGSGNINFTGAIANSSSITSAGNVLINAAAKYLGIHGGAVTDFCGSANLTSGTVTIANTNIGAADIVLMSRIYGNGSGPSTALGVLSYIITAGSQIIVNSLIPGTPASIQTGDNSGFGYVIIRQL